MSENIDELLKEIRHKNIKKRRSRLQGIEPEHKRDPGKRAKKGRIMHLRAVSRVRPMEFRRADDNQLNEKELNEIFLRVEGKK